MKKDKQNIQLFLSSKEKKRKTRVEGVSRERKEGRRRQILMDLLEFLFIKEDVLSLKGRE